MFFRGIMVCNNIMYRKKPETYKVSGFIDNKLLPFTK